MDQFEINVVSFEEQCPGKKTFEDVGIWADNAVVTLECPFPWICLQNYELWRLSMNMNECKKIVCLYIAQIHNINIQMHKYTQTLVLLKRADYSRSVAWKKLETEKRQTRNFLQFQISLANFFQDGCTARKKGKRSS